MDRQMIISIGRQFGSGGYPIGRMLAEHYGIKLYDRNLIDMPANHPNALRIFIYAPVEFKIPHVKENYNILTDALPPLRRFRASSPLPFGGGEPSFSPARGNAGFPSAPGEYG